MRIYYSLTAVLVMVPSLALAATPTPTATAQAVDPQRINGARCSDVAQKVAVQIGQITSQGQSAIGQYRAGQSRLQAAEQRLRAHGYVTAKLQADLALYGQKVTAATTAYTGAIGSVTEVENDACGRSGTVFRTDLATARTQVANLQSAVEEIPAFYQATLRPDLLQLRSQTPKP